MAIGTGETGEPAAAWSPRLFGTRYIATLLGISFVMHQAGSSLGAWGGGLILKEAKALLDELG